MNIFKQISSDSNEVIIDTRSPVTITPLLSARPGERFVFSNFDRGLHTLNVRELPAWFSAGDYIEYRKKRTVAVSISQTEPRWRRLLRRLRLLR